MGDSSKKRQVLDWWARYLIQGEEFPNLALLRGGHGGGEVPPSAYKQMQNDVRNGLGPSLYPVGSSITVRHATYGDLTFDVGGHNIHKKPGDSTAPTMTLVMHDVITGVQFDSEEAAYAVTAEQFPGGLPAGTYYFGIGSMMSSQWSGAQFEISRPLPVGGQIVISGANLATNVIRTFSDPKSASPLADNIQMQDGTGGVFLGTLFFSSDDRNSYVNIRERWTTGNGNWRESNVRQWLNSNKAAGKWWNPAHIFDRCNSSLNGFLYGMDVGFVSSLGEVDVVTRTNTRYENDGQQGDNTYTTRDKIFLLSYDEAGFNTSSFGPDGNVRQGTAIPLYFNDSGTNPQRAKNSQTNPEKAVSWWLRSPHVTSSNAVRYVGQSGQRLFKVANTADDSIGISPACVIY